MAAVPADDSLASVANMDAGYASVASDAVRRCMRRHCAILLALAASLCVHVLIVGFGGIRIGPPAFTHASSTLEVALERVNKAGEERVPGLPTKPLRRRKAAAAKMRRTNDERNARTQRIGINLRQHERTARRDSGRRPVVQAVQRDRGARAARQDQRSRDQERDRSAASVLHSIPKRTVSNAKSDRRTDLQPGGTGFPDVTHQREAAGHPPLSPANMHKAVALIRAALTRHLRYPRRALDNGWQGKVVLYLQATGSGRLRSARILSGSGYHTLDSAALEAAEQTAKIPGLAGLMRGYSCSFRVPVVYRLGSD